VNRYKVAVIETDGIGREVVPAGLRVLEAAGLRHDIVLEDRPEDAGGWLGPVTRL
jgi:tartrate dehydrogenase/decarboxylase/D-malate dehydrogenase